MPDRLFIMGNGFDLAHDLKTSYNDFKEYLITDYGACSKFEDLLLLPAAINSYDGEVYFDETEAAEFFIRIIEIVIGLDWAEFEKALGEINIEDLFPEGLTVYDDDKEDNIECENPWKTSTNYEIFGNELYALMQKLKDFFEEWITKINISKSIKNTSIEKLLKEKNAIFLSFNYTHTLEEAYDVKNVLHIHGDIESEIYVGHGKEIEEIDDPYVNDCTYIGTQNSILNSFKKPVAEIIEKNELFFTSEIREIKEIYVFGFSFSDVDMGYFKEIFNNIDSTKTIIYLNSYDSKKFKLYEKKLIDAGFLGKFKTY